MTKSLQAAALVLWTVFGLPLAALPPVLSVAQAEACAKACGMERHECCCQRLGFKKSICVPFGEKRHPHAPRGPELERRQRPCAGAGQAVAGTARAFDDLAVAKSTALFVPDLVIRHRRRDQPRPVTDQAISPARLPRPPPAFLPSA